MIAEKKYKIQYRYHLKNYIFKIDNCIDKELCENTSTIEPFMEKIKDAVEKYMTEHLKYFSWFTEYSDISTVRFNKHTENEKTDLHCDLFEGDLTGSPILTVIGVLNDDYKGGNFIMFDEYEIELKQGDVIIFPSNFIYPYKVEPVTQGVRHSFISWVY